MSRSLKRTQKRTQSKQRGGKSKKNNPWLQQLAKAKENNTQEFKYNGKTYKQAVTKTGMVIYKSK